MPLLYIDQYIFNENKTRLKNLTTAQIHDKFYDMPPQSWLIHCLKIFKISNEFIKSFMKTMETWYKELTVGGKSLAEIKIERMIFLGDALLSLLFVTAMMPLNHIRRKCTCRHKFSKSQAKINHLMYMDSIKLFAKNEKDFESLKQTVRICSQDIGMESYIGKYAMSIMKSGKQYRTTGMEQPNEEKSERSKKKKLTNTREYGSGHHQTIGVERKKLKKDI